MNLNEKLVILSDAAKYDASCSSSGSKRSCKGYGNTCVSGICHSFSADGRCMSLLKILLTNSCIYDFKKENNELKKKVENGEIPQAKYVKWLEEQ